MDVTAKRRSTLALVHAVWGGVSMELKGNHDVHYGNQPMVRVSDKKMHDCRHPHCKPANSVGHNNYTSPVTIHPKYNVLQ
jgi:hypothetical protein